MRHFLSHPAGWKPSRLAEIYDETSFWSARFGGLLFDHLEIRRGIRGLDVGCGTGFPLIELAHVHGTSSHFVGTDTWVDALERARLKLELHGLTNVDIIEADVASMPFPNAHFDLVVSNLGINNFPDARAALRECRRVAKTNGRLVLTTNVQGHFGALMPCWMQFSASPDLAPPATLCIAKRNTGSHCALSRTLSLTADSPPLAPSKRTSGSISPTDRRCYATRL